MNLTLTLNRVVFFLNKKYQIDIINRDLLKNEINSSKRKDLCESSHSN